MHEPISHWAWRLRRGTAGLVCVVALVTARTFAAGLVDYAGTWQFEFSGGDSGRGTAEVDTAGIIRGNGFSAVNRVPVSIEGRIASDGHVQFSATPSGITSLRSTFIGVAHADGAATGSWTNPEMQLSGKWHARRGGRSEAPEQPGDCASTNCRPH